MNKKELRNQIRNHLATLLPSTYEHNSKAIAAQFLNDLIITNSQIIALTISNFPEVDTYHLIGKLWEQGKRVVVPKCNPVDRSMNFYEITQFNQLETVYMNLREPLPEKTRLIPPNEIDVLVVPGIVYDLDGFRIGYGGGYYDRYIVNYKGILISLAFDIQITEKVPREQHDLPVDMIITETRKINCKQHREGSFI